MVHWQNHDMSRWMVVGGGGCRVVWWLRSQCEQGDGQVTSGVVVGRVEMVDGVCGHCGVVVIAL